VHGRILVIDDEAAVCSSLQRLLAGEGDVVTVTSAREALELIGSGERFDVLLCDVMMPGMDAPALYEELLEVAPAQAERMVFMTGGAFTARARDFLERVPNARVDKPFDVAALRARHCAPSCARAWLCSPTRSHVGNMQRHGARDGRACPGNAGIPSSGPAARILLSLMACRRIATPPSGRLAERAVA
jgi:CheY-like chemotaxis protein